MKKLKRLVEWIVFIFTLDGVIAEEAKKEGILK
jgi:hypothetical protein